MTDSQLKLINDFISNTALGDTYHVVKNITIIDGKEYTVTLLYNSEYTNTLAYVLPQISDGSEIK